jgi:hypothetical protein
VVFENLKNLKWINMFVPLPIRTAIIHFLIILSLTGTSIAKLEANNSEKKKPSVILLFTDQHNKKVMGFEDHSDVITPNLDKLANEQANSRQLLLCRTYFLPSAPTLKSIAKINGYTKDLLEVDNKINDPNYIQELTKLRNSCYELKKNTTAIGKELMIRLTQHLK